MMPYKIFRLFCLLFFLALFVTEKAQTQTGNGKLPHRKPLAKEFSPNFLNGFTKEIATQIPSIGSFIVCRADTVLYEHYFHGATDSTLFNVKSVTKSILSALAGVAKNSGLLPDLNTPVLEILTGYSQQAPPAGLWFLAEKRANDSLCRKLTLKNLLTMQTGLQWDDFGPMATAFVFSSDPVRFVLDLPFAEEPGETFVYCSGAAAVFGAALAKLVKTDLKEFANTNLFHPIGAQLTRWDTDPQGRYEGASEMHLTAQDLVRFGLLYLHNGHWNGTPIISALWVKESVAEHAKLTQWPVLPNANGYGYYWWRRKSFGRQCYIASGAGGQLVYVVPDVNLIIVATCFLNEKNRGRSELKRLHAQVDKIISEITSHKN